MKFCSKNVVLLFLIVILLVSGCVSPSKVDTSLPMPVTEQSTLIAPTQEIEDHSLFIHIDPVQDFQKDSHYNITGQATLNINVTTNFPTGSLFWIDIINEDTFHSILFNEVISAEKRSEELNTFSYAYNMKGNPPGHYRVEIRKANKNITAIARFNILSPEPWISTRVEPGRENINFSGTPNFVTISFPGPWIWIKTDPVGETHEGENLNVSGTTNLAAGSEMTIKYGMELHPCPQDKPLITWGRKDFCYGNCNFNSGQSTIKVISDASGKNTWAYTINTKDWCVGESYGFDISVSNWTNVTHGGAAFRFGR